MTLIPHGSNPAGSLSASEAPPRNAPGSRYWNLYSSLASNDKPTNIFLHQILDIRRDVLVILPSGIKQDTPDDTCRPVSMFLVFFKLPCKSLTISLNSSCKAVSFSQDSGGKTSFSSSNISSKSSTNLADSLLKLMTKLRDSGSHARSRHSTYLKKIISLSSSLQT